MSLDSGFSLREIQIAAAQKESTRLIEQAYRSLAVTVSRCFAYIQYYLEPVITHNGEAIMRQIDPSNIEKPTTDITLAEVYEGRSGARVMYRAYWVMRKEASERPPLFLISLDPISIYNPSVSAYQLSSIRMDKSMGGIAKLTEEIGSVKGWELRDRSLVMV